MDERSSLSPRAFQMLHRLRIGINRESKTGDHSFKRDTKRNASMNRPSLAEVLPISFLRSNPEAVGSQQDYGGGVVG